MLTQTQKRILYMLLENKREKGIKINKIVTQLKSNEIAIRQAIDALYHSELITIELSPYGGKPQRLEITPKGTEVYYRSTITKETDNMFDDMLRDNVTIIKQNGKVYENIKSDVQPKNIFIEDGTLPIEEGDIISRILPNGMTERYIVLDRGYYEAFAGIKAHYQCEVRKETAIPRNPVNSTVTYNLNGNNPRVNINSTDSSTNIVNTNSENLFEELRNSIKTNLKNEQEISQLTQLINEMEHTRGLPEFTGKYQKFITSAANHMTILSPFIPALTQLLG